MDGHSTTYQPSSPSLITTLYFISRSHPLKMCFRCVKRLSVVGVSTLLQAL
jgi:hypothetical protein